MKESKDSKSSPASSSKLDDSIKKSSNPTIKNTLNESLNENLASASNADQSSNGNDSLNNSDTNVTSANPDVRQRRLQHFQTNTASQ